MTLRRKSLVSAGPSRWLLLTVLLAVLPVMLAGCGLDVAVTDYIDSKDTSLRKRVSVVPFDSGIKELKPRAATLGQAVAKHLGSQGGLVLVDFIEVETALPAVPTAGRSPEKLVQTAAREAGLTAVLTGVLTDLSVQYRLKGIYGFRDNIAFLTLEAQLKVMDIGTSAVAGQMAFKREIQVDDVHAEAIRNGAPPDQKLVNKLQAELIEDAQHWAASQINAIAWTGQVLAVEGNRIKLSVSHDTGLPLGSVLNVYALGDRIKTGSGQELALPGPLAGKLRLVELGARASWAEPVEKKGLKNTFEPDQLVRTR
jgi:hypothetical protein